MRTTIVAVIALLATLDISAEPQQPTGRGPGRGVTLTRSASKYQQLESQILGAMQERKAQGVNALVAPDLEVWSAERSGSIGRDEWLQAGLASRLESFRIRDVAVREFGEQAIVSFLLERRVTGRTTVSTDFVVDIWDVRRDVLLVRYVSTPTSPAPSSRGRE